MKRSLVLSTISTVLLVGCGSAQQAAISTYVTQVQPIVTGFSNQADKLSESSTSLENMKAISQSLEQTIDSLKAIEPTDPVIKEAHAHLILAPTHLKEAADAVVTAMQNPINAPADLEQKIDSLTKSAEEEMNSFYKTMEPILPEDLKKEWASDK